VSSISYAETQVVAVVLNDTEGDRIARARHIPPEAFTDSTCRALWEKIVSLPPGQPAGMALVGSGLDEADLRRISETEISLVNFAGHIETVVGAWIERRAKSAAGAYQRGQITLEDLGKELAAVDGLSVSRAQQLRALRFDPAIDPPEQRVIYRIGKIPICTAGNLANITAEAKAGKTAFTGAMLAAAMTTGPADCFTIGAENSAGHALLHFDTETSRADWHTQLCRAKRRAGLETFPPWLVSYHLTGRSPQECRRDVEDALAAANREFGGVFAVFIDGIGDLVFDPNDPEECFPLVTRLHALAIQYDTAIVNILHKNPGTEKTRGHLGSQLERKGESNLALEKDGEGVTVVYSLKQRGASIPKSDGPRFRWSDGEGMHVSAETARDANDRDKSQSLFELAADVFGDRNTMTYSDLRNTVKTTANCSERTADARVSEMKRLKVVRWTPPNLYSLVR
jgi:hypothetical protein